MKKATWKILVLALLVGLMLGLTTTALAATVKNEFKIDSGKFTLEAGATKTVTVPLEAKANNVTVSVEISSIVTGEEIKVDENRITYQFKKGTGKDYSGAKEVALTGKTSDSQTYSNVAKGNYRVDVTSYANTKSVACRVVVSGSYKITFDITSKKVVKGDTFTLSLENAKGVTGTKTWSSSDKKVATVSSKGKVTAKGPGTATISCSVGGQTPTMKVTVYALDTESATIYTKESITLSVPKAKSVTWSSSDPSIAKVSSKGKVTGVKPGKVKITATFPVDGGTAKQTAKITVKQNPYPKVMIVVANGIGKLNLRQKADPKSKSLGLYSKNTRVLVQGMEKDGVWCKVKVSGQTGYMQYRFLGAVTSGKVNSGTTAKTVKLYSEMSKSSTVLAKIPNNTKVTVVSWTSLSYVQVKYNGKTGYVLASQFK